MQAFLRWTCKVQSCRFAGNPGTSVLCKKCRTERGAVVGLPCSSCSSSSIGDVALIGRPSKRAKLADERIDFALMYKGCKLPDPWLAGHNGSVLFRAASVAKKRDLKGVKKVAGFDFDGCLFDGRFAIDASAGFSSDHVLFDHTIDVLKALSSNHFRVVIFTNELLDRFRKPDAIRNALTRKLMRLDKFLEYAADVPIEVFVATANDRFRKPSTKDRKRKGPACGGIGMWEFMMSDPLKLGFSKTEFDKSASFFVGDGAGREKDFHDGDRMFAVEAGLPFHTPESFFLEGGVAEELTGVRRLAGEDMIVPEGVDVATEIKKTLEAQDGKVVVVLAGIPGSGKSTFGEYLCEMIGREAVQRFSQDALGKKGNVAEHASKALQDSNVKLVLIDRTNMTQAQRETWVELAQNHGSKTILIFWDLSFQECVQRCFSRKNHEGKNFPTDLDAVHAVLTGFQASKEFVRPEEGFLDTILVRSGKAKDEIVWKLSQILNKNTTEQREEGSRRSKGMMTLVFSSISTGDFTFPAFQAMDVLFRTAERFLKESAGFGNVELVLVEQEKSEVGQVLKTEKFQQMKIPGLTVKFADNIVDVAETVKAAALAIGSGDRLAKPAENRSNVLVHRLLLQDENVPAEILELGKPFKLVTKKGEKIYFVLGPNLNPKRPGSIDGDHNLAQVQLEECYINLFSEFLKDGTQQHKTDLIFNSYDHPNADPPSSKRGWKGAFFDFMETELSPAHEAFVFFQNDNYVVIYDAFPKSKVHLLVLPRAIKNINSINELQKERHLEALQDLKEFVNKLMKHMEPHDLKAGFHAIPSLDHLHLHVISQDFESDRLKNKKHWNSFTNPTYFIELERVIEALQAQGKMNNDLEETAKEALKAPLQCPRCASREPKTVPEMKRHLQNCTIK